MRDRRWIQPEIAWLLLGSLIAFIATLILTFNAAARGLNSPLAQSSPLHPIFPLLDEKGQSVLDSGGAVSTMKTCGACHDTAFIEGHSYHVSQGLQDITGPGELEGSRPWDTSPGLFGRWTPLAYRYLSPEGDERMDLGTPGWIQVYGPRHVGGGPAVYARDGTPLEELLVVPGDPQTHLLDPDTGELIPWDWSASGVVEMNCFLCHIPSPNNQARVDELHEGNFRWANTATLLETGIVEQEGDSYRWNPEAFDDEGNLLKDVLIIQDPSNHNCAACHGLVHDDLQQPLSILGCSPERIRTVTTGQIISPQRLSDTGMNLQDKDELTRPWDIHADHLVGCTDCHYSLNNPIYFQEDLESQPEHLIFDPRRLELGEYLYQPLHQFARGESAHNTVAPQLRNTMRRCDACHSIEATHDWLPYKDRHMQIVSCETCHIPEMYSNALMEYDWTVLTEARTGSNSCRGLEGDSPESVGALVTGFEPLLLLKMNIDGETQLTPFNLVTSYYWIYGDPPRPVRLIDLEAAWFEGGSYAPDVIDVFDTNADGVLEKTELIIDTPVKEALIAGRLKALGLDEPRIYGEIQPYSINHTVATGEWAIRECTTCHGEESRITQSFQLTAYLPGGVTPTFVGDSNTVTDADKIIGEGGVLYYQPETRSEGLYVLGHNAVRWVDALGGFAFLGVLLGVVLHGALRVYVVAREKPEEPVLKRVYLYGVYERLWHWLQTFTVVGLLFTGLIIHKPDIFGIFSFRYMVLVHNTLAVILAVNATLALFYHLASGEIRQYLPRPYGFFDQAILQAKYYLRGIFRSERHPFEKTLEKKLNPLQQITYIAILNVLLPLQGITGLLIWGSQRWPEIAAALGGLPFLASFHALIAWLFAAFIVLHVYLTTTGPTPLSSIKAMMDGWDDVEEHSLEEEDA